MPYKFEKDKLKIPRILDRRIKLNDDDKKEILNLFNNWESINSISKIFSVSRRTIQFIIYPDRLQRCKELYAIRRLDWRYYDKEKCTKAMKYTRDYKQDIKDKLV